MNHSRLLKRTWPVFFRGFGSLMEVQKRALQPLLAGRNTVISAPAASGKTEAVFAPMLERALHFGIFDSPGYGLLYVAPTRALVNDIHERLKEKLPRLGVELARRTGDKKDRQGAEPSGVLLTTPESLDALLSRKGEVWGPRVGVILDELHMVDGVPRGDQLRVLLRRLALGPGRPALRFAAMSATFSDPAEVASRYFPVESVVLQENRRSMRLHRIKALVDLPDLMNGFGWKKLLVFANTRAATEQCARELRLIWPGQRICVHHGSIERAERLEAEAALREWKSGICVATSTLEVGIDIGDVDAVLLVDLPGSVAAFSQRIARGSRRRGTVEVAVRIASETDEAAFHLLMGALEQHPDPGPAPDSDPSVLVQQVFSILYGQRDGLPLAAFAELFEPLAPSSRVELVLMHLCSLGLVKAARGRYLPSTELLDLGEKGLIHSNIPDSRERQIYDGETGRPLASLSLNTRAGEELFLAGRHWTVVEALPNRVTVRPSSGGAEGEVRFRKRATRSPFARYLPPELGADAPWR